jgi:hypothetical protein
MFDEREPAEPELTHDLQAVEGQLARLTPVAARVDRDRLMFEAGRVAARPRWPGYIAEPSWLGGRLWPAMTALMTAASLLLAVSLLWQRRSFEIALQERPQQATSVAQAGEQRPAEILSTNPQPSLATAEWMTLRQPAAGYLGIRYAALTRGVNAIDTGPLNSGIVEPIGELNQSQRKMLDELLPVAKSAKHSRS